MIKRKIRFMNIIFIFVCIFATTFLFGCKHDSIKFYRESQFQQIKDKLGIDTNEKKQNNRVIQSSSMLIYRYEEASNKSQSSPIRFGPSDIKFDINIK